MYGLLHVDDWSLLIDLICTYDVEYVTYIDIYGLCLSRK